MLYISTCNGIERWPHWHGKPARPPNPDAPNLIVLDKFTGRLVATDAETGQRLWVHETRQETWGSTLVADGKVYLVTRKGFHVLATGREKTLLGSVRMGAECTPIAADRVLFVVLRGTLFALHQPPPAAAEQERISQVEEDCAKLVEPEVEVPKAMAETFRSGR
jgi:hypothetical protein